MIHQDFSTYSKTQPIRWHQSNHFCLWHLSPQHITQCWCKQNMPKI